MGYVKFTNVLRDIIASGICYCFINVFFFGGGGGGD